jgi:chromosome segregation ATPase
MNKKSTDKSRDTEKVLIENFVALQKVMTNLSGKFDNLAHQISKLLDLFEMSAKALAEKDFELEKINRENMKLLEKIENVLEQNKTIARGLTLMHDRIGEPKSYTSQIAERQPVSQQQRNQPRPLSEETLRLLRLKEKQKTPGMGGTSERYTQPPSSNEQ